MTMGVREIYSWDGMAAELSTTAGNVVPFDSFGPLTSPTMRSFHSLGTQLVLEHSCDGKSVPPRSRRAWCESGTSLSQVYETLDRRVCRAEAAHRRRDALISDKMLRCLPYLSPVELDELSMREVYWPARVAMVVNPTLGEFPR
jgi:hypothetical protein